MNDKNLVRGLLLVAIALAFGIASLRMPIGRLSHAGPGLFPLMVSVLLLLVGLATVLRARLQARERLQLPLRNIALVLASLGGFALVSQFVNMIAGIVFLVFCASLAASSYSVARNVKVSLGLIVVAFGFKQLLGLNLPLY